MKVLFADAVYPEILRAAEKADPALPLNPSWRERTRAYLAFRFGCWDSWSHAFRSLGVEAEEVITDKASALPDALAEKRDAVVLRHPLLSREEKELLHRPDLVVPMVTSDARAWKWTDEVFAEPPVGIASLYVTSFPQYVSRPGWRYLPPAFDPRRLPVIPVPWRDRPYPVTFCGSLGFRQWKAGTHAMSRVAEVVPEFRWWGVKAGDVGEHLDRTYSGPAYGTAYDEILAGTKIALNRHGDVNYVRRAGGRVQAEAANMRLFEATGMGCLLLTEAAGNLADLFVPWEECVPYGNPEELASTVRFLLDHPDRAEKIAAAGQARTLREHTYANRAATLLAWMQEALR